MRNRNLLVLLPSLLAACVGGGSWDKTHISDESQPFSDTVAPQNANAPAFEDRYGPEKDPWADKVSMVYSPFRSGPQLTDLSAPYTGPSVLVGSLAVFAENSGKTVAIDLSTKQEKWQLPSQGFLPGFLLTDGTSLCGVALKIPASSFEADLLCMELSTGAIKWRKTVNRWLNPAQGQGYGPDAQLSLYGTSFFVAGGGAVAAYSIADGTELWSLNATTHQRALVFVADQLVLEGVKDGCTSGSSCLRAVNPATGATLSEYPAESASFLWADGSKATFLTPYASAVRTAVVYDASTSQFSEDTTLAATFEQVPGLLLSANTTLGGISPVLETGKVYLLAWDTFYSWPAAILCRYHVSARAMDWCQQVSGVTRIHPNAIIAAQGPSLWGAPLEPGSDYHITQRRLYYGKWGFAEGGVYAYR